MEYGWLAIIPPLVAITLAFVTKRVLISLFLGIFSGGLIISGWNPFSGTAYTLSTVIGSITDEWNASLLLFNLLMGSGVAFIWRLGGSEALTTWARKKIKTRKAAGVGAWLLGILIFFNDYVNAAIVGNVFRDISEEHKISSERLSYILDSTAAPVATFFISDWIAFQIGMVKTGMETAGITSIEPFTAYLYSIPLNLYSIFAVLLVGMLVITERDFGPMLKAEHRAVTEGKIVRDGAKPMLDVNYELGEPKDTKPMLITFFLPLIVLVGVTLFGFWFTGRGAGGITDILGASDPAKALLWGAFAMAVTGIVMAISTKIMNLAEAMDTFVDGLKLMLLACVILVMAWSLGTITAEMDLAGFIVKAIPENLPFVMIPIIIFLLGMLISFATGTSWGTMTILTPIAIPLAYVLTNDAYISVAMAGVVFSGSIFGDHCSPISDTTVLASIFSGADHIDHVSTQVPYAITAAIIAISMYLLWGQFFISPFILIPVGIVLLFGLMYGLSNLSRKKYGINPITKTKLNKKKAN